MEKRVNVIDLKNLLRAELKIFDEKKFRYENALYERDIYSEFIGYLTLDDLELLDSNILSLGLLFPLIYDEGKTRFLEEEFYKVLYLIKRLSGNRDLKDEYESAVKKLKGLVNSIINEYNILCNKLAIYEQEYANTKKTAYDYRGALYSLNVGLYVTDKQIVAIKNLLENSGYNYEEQIVFMELLNHHNIRVKYDNPIISYTTIKMVESNFENYELEEFDKTKKSKLDECANAIFDAIMYEDDDKKEFEITLSIISLMDNNEKEYTIKKTLNKFLGFLRECKHDMIQDNNYEDLELRKMIIHEYNSYYYKYKTLADYYNLHIAATLDEKEKIDFGGGIESLQTEYQNNLFFAKGTSKSYVERDIEDVPEEYYQRVKKLLEGFALNILPETNVESFVSNSLLKGYRKLKEDQIRIVFRKLSENNYLILGVMLKKSTDANKQYTNIIKRDYNYDISTPELYDQALTDSNEIYTNLINYLDSNARKGNR